MLRIVVPVSVHDVANFFAYFERNAFLDFKMLKGPAAALITAELRIAEFASAIIKIIAQYCLTPKAFELKFELSAWNFFKILRLFRRQAFGVAFERRLYASSEAYRGF